MSSIRKRPGGVWRARYRDQDGKEHARHFPRKVDAQSWLDRVTTSIVTGHYVDPLAGRITFAAYFKDWSSRQIWVTGTQRAMGLSARSVPFGELELRRIKRSHIEAWIKDMTARKLAANTVVTRYNHVHSVFRAAVKDRLIGVDPADGIALPRIRRASVAMRLPTSAEVRRLLDAADDTTEVMIALAAFAGLRVSEVRAVQLGDVQFLRRTLQIRRQAQHQRGTGLEIIPPKHGSERDVFLPDQLVKMLSAHVVARSIAGAETWLFKAVRGDGPVHEGTFERWWTKARAEAKVSDIKFHDLRHYFASGLIAAGCDVVTVQRACGHSTPSITLNVYSHLWPTAEDRTRKAAADLMRSALSSPADSVRTAGE